MTTVQHDHKGALAHRAWLAEHAEGLDRAEEDLGRVAPADEVEPVDEDGPASGDVLW